MNKQLTRSCTQRLREGDLPHVREKLREAICALQDAHEEFVSAALENPGIHSALEDSATEESLRIALNILDEVLQDAKNRR